MNILMVEDDEDLSNVVVSQLQKEGYITDVCVNGNDVALFLENGEYDLVLLDRMLPGKDGIQVLKELRSRENTIPVIFITALGEIEDRIEGLDAGADDYLTKPYDIEELKARIRAIARRPLKMEDNHEFAIGSTILDMSRYILRNGEKEISLSKREALLCLLLFRNIGQVLEREKILRKVRGRKTATRK